MKKDKLTFTIDVRFDTKNGKYSMRIQDTKFGRYAWIKVSKDFAKSIIDVYNLKTDSASGSTIYQS